MARGRRAVVMSARRRGYCESRADDCFGIAANTRWIALVSSADVVCGQASPD